MASETYEWFSLYTSDELDMNGNSWTEELAHIGGDSWLVKICDDPCWSIGYEPNEALCDRRSTEELVSWVVEMDTASTEDTEVRPRQLALLEVAEQLSHTELLKQIKAQIALSEQQHSIK